MTATDLTSELHFFVVAHDSGMQTLWFVGNTHLKGKFDNIASQKMYNISRVFMTFFCFLSPKADSALQYVCLNCAKILSIRCIINILNKS